MHTDHDPIDPKTLAEMGYERRDVSPRPMAWAAFWLLVFTVGSGLMGAVLIKVWNIVPEVSTEQRAFHKVQPPKDTPILQNNSDNTADIAALRSKEAEVLNNYSKEPDKEGFYRIPIDKAIMTISQRGLPVTQTQTVTRPAVPNGPAGAAAPGATATFAAPQVGGLTMPPNATATPATPNAQVAPNSGSATPAPGGKL